MPSFITDYIHLDALDPKLSFQDEDINKQLVLNSKVGVEIEGEGLDARTIKNKLDGLEYGAYWHVTRDGSLRGRNFEAVFARPLSGHQIYNALEVIQKAIDTYQGRYDADFNARTSVHVHINCRDLTVDKIATLVGLYLIFEEALFNYAGAHRRDNNYSTRLVDDDSAISFLQTCMSGNNGCIREALTGAPFKYINGIRSERSRLSKYSALNMCTLAIFGTLEFRHHPGEYKAERLFEWINIILCLKKWVISNDVTIDQLPAYLSGIGTRAMCDMVFGDLAPKLYYTDMDIDGYCGIRAIQSAILAMRKPKKKEEKENSLGSKLIRMQEEEQKARREQLIKEARGNENLFHVDRILNEFMYPDRQQDEVEF